ncbi:MAG TPA: DJ-1/PfpI family protein [Candidatus Kapabacteria bacterium]|nr:DJ-1/PfpI family protein [Candidatus Kapabacteria bacterium]
MNVAILIFPDAEVLDFAGPFEVLNVANRVAGKELFTVVLIAERKEVVVARNGFRVLPEYSIDEEVAIDVLIIPGGPGRVEQMKNKKLLQWVNNTVVKTEWLMSVCTGAFILAEAGLLRGLQATTHWGNYDEFENNYPGIELKRDVRYTENHKIWTSGGISAGIDMMLQFISKLHGKELAEKTAKRMEFKF